MIPSSPRLLLVRHAETAWREVIRPWLEGSHQGLSRNYVVVPTRGQAQGLKQRCAFEGVALLGVEFLSPGLARQKWLPLGKGKPVIGRELLLFELRRLIAVRLSSTAPDAPGYGLLKSLRSDAERALDDFDELTKAGFGPAEFEHEALRALFQELMQRIDGLGYSIGSVESRRAAEQSPVEKLSGRLLVYGLSAEAWGEFANVAAFVRHFTDVTVLIPEPEFLGNRALDEAWSNRWEALLGVDAEPLDADEPDRSCGHVAEWWGNEYAGVSDGGTSGARVIVGRTRLSEMALVAEEVVRLLGDPSSREGKSIAVVFPRADAAHLCLMQALERRGVAFVNLLPSVGAPGQETQLLRRLINFYAQGGRLDELLAVWPLLKAAGHVQPGLAEARRVVEALFEVRQTHFLSAYAGDLEERKHPVWSEVNKVTQLLLPPWPDELTLTDALGRIEKLCEAFLLTPPANWTALNAFAGKETAALPLPELCELLLSFVPENAPAAGIPSHGGFARVTLTTRRRAEGLAWSHVIFVESNAGIWPQQNRVSGWLTDEHRALLNRGSASLPGLFSSDDRAWLEKRSFAALARDTSEELIFSAALADEIDPEAALAPNSWMERVLWHTSERNANLQEVFQGLARERIVRGGADSEAAWLLVWQGRREPRRPFDEYFLSIDPERLGALRLSARLIEAGIQDPATLWFEAVLQARRTDPTALLRQGKRVLGGQVHRVLSAALRGASPEGAFFAKPERGEVEQRMAEQLARVRTLWPQDRYWDSFHAKLTQTCALLVESLYSLPQELPGLFATERWLPEQSKLVLPGGTEVAVSGRMDLFCSDREEWIGSTVDIIDFKTGGDELSERKMADKGAGLQLGVYLSAARMLGARSGRVWMVKPDGVAMLDLTQLDQALIQLQRLELNLQTGHFGALTKAQSDYSAPGFIWPLACTPIEEQVLQQKYVATFGGGEQEEQADA